MVPHFALINNLPNLNSCLVVVEREGLGSGRGEQGVARLTDFTGNISDKSLYDSSFFNLFLLSF